MFRRVWPRTLAVIAGVFFFAALGLLGQQTATAPGAAHKQPSKTEPRTTAGPSLAETTAWLAERIQEASLSGSGVVDYGRGVTDNLTVNQGTYHAEWSGCKLVLHYSWQGATEHRNPGYVPDNSDIHNSIIYDVAVDLSFLKQEVTTSERHAPDQGVVMRPAWMVNLVAPSRNSTPFHFHEASTWGGKSGTKDYSEVGLAIPFSNAELAGRIAKAFTHAIQLCSKKGEPF